MRPRHEDLRAARRPAHLEHVGLDRLADAVVLERALLAGGEDRLHALADVEDDRPGLDAADGARQQLALAVRELVEDLVALDLADPLQDDLLRGLRADAAEVLAVQLLDLDDVAGPGVVLGLAGLLDGDLDHRVLDLVDDIASAIDVDPAAVRLDAHEDVLLAGDPAVGSLDAFLEGPDERLAGDLLLGVELEQRTDEVTTHPVPPCILLDGGEAPVTRRNVGWSPTFRGGLALLRASIHPDPWTTTLSEAQFVRRTASLDDARIRAD